MTRTGPARSHDAGFLFAVWASLGYGAMLAAVVWLSVRAADGRLIYALDDPYIHLSVAEQILGGGYGVNAGEYAAPSSSILYPVLLAGGLGLGLGDLAPLVLTVPAQVVAVWMLARFAWREGGLAHWRFGPIAGLLLGPLVGLAINGLSLPMTGMEHALHVLASVAIVAGLVHLARDGRPAAWLLLAIVLAPLLRYEGAALSLAALAVLLWLGHVRAAALTGLALAVAFSAHAWIMLRLGLPVLPSSVLLKSGAAAAAHEGDAPEGLFMALAGVFRTFREPFGVLLIAAICASLAALRTVGRSRKPALLAGMAAIGAHVLAGHYGWFGRYEVYAVAIALMLMILMWGALPKQRGVKGSLQLCGALLFLGFPSAAYLIATGNDTHAAARNVHEQQYQMHRFATRYFPHPVAVNDLGWVSYRNDVYVLDLWGLGSENVRRLRQAGEFGSGAVAELAREAGVAYAMVYDEWLARAIPDPWCRIAELRTIDVVAASDRVAFYRVERDLESEMRAALDAVAQSLPDGPELRVTSCEA
jgi:hypothetical protein